MAERPGVNIYFRQLASTLIKRSGERPVIILSETAEEGAVLEKIDILKGKVTAEGMAKYAKTHKEELAKSVNFALASSPDSLYVTNMGSGELFKNLLALDLTNAVITAGCEGSAADDVKTGFISFNSKYQAGTVYIGNAADKHDIRYISVNTEDVKYYDNDGAEMSEYAVLSMYAGAIAACGCERSLTNYELPCGRAEYTAEFGSEPDLVEKGQLGAETKGGKPRVIAGINTAEVSGDITEDMQYIEVINTMDVIAKDINDTFVNYYRGKYKNDYDNQLLLVAAIDKYFEDLGREEILDPDYANVCEIDVDSQRAAWIAQGKEEAADWDELTVKENTYKRMVYLTADIKICQSMESLTMYITLE